MRWYRRTIRVWGPDSVRGFNVREVANDRGYSGSLELYTPELGTKFNWNDVKLRALAFVDFGTTGATTFSRVKPPASREAALAWACGSRMPSA
jgi:hemolysin activation/secretion protein